MIAALDPWQQLVLREAFGEYAGTEIVRALNGTTNREDHYFCECDPDLGLCGTDLRKHVINEGCEVSCVVCDDLAYEPCERCGA